MIRPPATAEITLAKSIGSLNGLGSRVFLTFIKETTIAYHPQLLTWRVLVWYAIVVPFRNVKKI